MQSTTILQYMKKHGQKLDREIAKDTGIELPQVRLAITKLQSTKAVFSCNVINFENGDYPAIFHLRQLAENLRHKHR